MARPMRLLAAAASPFVWLLSKSTAGVTRLLRTARGRNEGHRGGNPLDHPGGGRGRRGAAGRTADRRPGLLAGRPHGGVDHDPPQRNGVARRGDERAADPREGRRRPHNRYPVGDGTLDRLLGVVYLKDLFVHLPDEGFDLHALIEPAKFFHEGFEVYNALEQLRNEQLGYGIICDEFGVTRGIITLRDIFEALVGEPARAERGAGHRSARGRQLPGGRTMPVLRLPAPLRCRGGAPHQRLQHRQRPDPSIN